MVWPFKKEKKEVIDFTYLAKRGLIRPEEVKELAQPTGLASEPTGAGALGFLSSIASASEAADSVSPVRDVGTKNKLDDFEYKLDGFWKRLNNIIDRLDLIEKKVDRLERHGI